MVRAFTAPLFMAGTLMLLGAPTFPPLALLALPGLLVPLTAQGLVRGESAARQA